MIQWELCLSKNSRVNSSTATGFTVLILFIPNLFFDIGISNHHVLLNQQFPPGDLQEFRLSLIKCMVIYCLCIYLYIINSNTYSLIILPYLYTLFMSLSHSVSPFLSTHWCPLLISHTPFCPAVSFSFLFLQMPSYLSFTSTLPLFPIFQAELCWLFFNATISCQNSSVLSTEFIKSLPTVHHTHSPLCDI